MKDHYNFLAGGGDMGARMRAMAWEKTPLGPVESWPESLRSALSICLGSRFPIAIYWGEALSLLYNDAWSPIPGGKHPGALGRGAREVWPEIWDTIGPLFEHVLSTGESTYAEDSLLLMHRHGFTEECYFNFTFTPIRGAGGQVEGVFNAVIETTYRVISERRARVLRELSERLAAAKSPEEAYALAVSALGAAKADVAFCGIYAVDEGGRTARLVAGERLPPGAAHSVPLDALGSFEAALVAPIQASASTTPAGYLVVGLSPRLALDDEYRQFVERAASHIGKVVSSAAALAAERKRAEALAELDRAKTAFFSNVSHEFRTPLTLMLGPVEDMLAKPAGGVLPENRELLSVVHRNGQRLLRLVNTLLDFARIESGRTQASYEPVDLAAFTAELASNFRSACERAGLALTVECPPLAEPAYVDREMWEKIVLNLVSNAFKFTLEGRIHVRLLESPCHFELRVSDTGTGIPAAELARIFERFHRVEGARGRSHEGSGIGLALVQELVKLHGGTIAAESAPGQGATFTVSIPRGKAHLAAERIRSGRSAASTAVGAGAFVEEALSWLPGNAAPAQARPAGALQRILLADDNADLREYARRLLAEHYEVEAVADGEAALAAARARRPDLVVSDVMMPKLDGFGLIHALRADPGLRTVPVVLLSARAGEEARVEGLDRGADDYLVKPFSARELLVRVGAMLRAAELRRESMDALRASEERYRAVVESQADMLCRFRSDGTILFVNLAYAKARGSTVEALEGRSFWDFVAEADRPAVRAMLDALTPEAPEVRIENRFLAAGGERWTLWMNRALAFDAAGRWQEAQSTGIDITERKQAETALRAGEERLRLAAQAARFGTYDYDAASRRNDWSAEAKEIAGLPRDGEPVPVERIAELIHPDDRPRVKEKMRSCLDPRGSGMFEDEHRLVRPDGSERWVLARGRTLFAGEGAERKALRATGIVLDITERKRAEQALRASETRYRALLGLMPAAVYTCDASGVISFYNEHAATLWGRAPRAGDTDERFCGSYRLWRPDGALMPHAETPMAVAVREGRSFRNEEVVIERPDGSRITVLVNIDPLRDEQGAPTGAINVFHDTTALKAAEAQLREADRRKDEFLATLSHELRNPLAPLKNSLHLLALAGKAYGPSASILEMMERQVGHLVRLVDDLLEMSRISRGAFELRKERVQAAAVVRNALETSDPLIKAAGHRLAVSLPEEPLWLEGDPVRLAQILANLLNNAAKYTEPGGAISVEARKSGAAVEITVRDNGPGLSPEALAGLFGMFSRGEGASGRTQGGLGIGLAISRRLAEMHGGTLTAQSDGPGKGATFTLRLALAADQSAGAGELAAPAAATLPPRRILVVDDNRDAAESLGMLLKFLGADVRVARDGREALEAFGAYEPSVVLLDIGMPGMDGYQVARLMRTSFPERRAAIIALTGWGQADDRRRAREAGFDHHLIKPADIGALQALLSSLEGRGLRH